jgi:hypothetical protein
MSETLDYNIKKWEKGIDAAIIDIKEVNTFIK